MFGEQELAAQTQITFVSKVVVVSLQKSYILDYYSPCSYTLSYESLSSPKNLAVFLVDISRIGVQWTPATGATWYKIELIDEKQTMSTVAITTQTACILKVLKKKHTYTQDIITALEASTLYYIHVYASNGFIYESTGATISATTAINTCNNVCYGFPIIVNKQCKCFCAAPCYNYHNRTDCSCSDGCITDEGTFMSGVACDDGNSCTSNDKCYNGSCVGEDTCAGKTTFMLEPNLLVSVANKQTYHNLTTLLGVVLITIVFDLAF
jgi:hypothetical protein